MRQVLSWRFVAALAALVGLALLVNALFVGQDTVARVVERSGPTTRRADLVSIVLDSDSQDFAIRRNGFSRGRIDLRLLGGSLGHDLPGHAGDDLVRRPR